MDMQERINAYWSKRADEFGDARYADMQGEKRRLWSQLIRTHMPKKDSIKVLDLGTGAGFFAFILHDLGCHVTAIDYSEDMLANAHKNAQKLGYQDITFLQMDAQNLIFDEESFDFIFTRNVTWTLPDPAKAYQEMVRVLAKGGILMNADANYSAGFDRMDEAGLTEKAAMHANTQYAFPAASLEMLRERNDIARTLYIAKADRPFWDLKLLAEYGMEEFWTDLDVNANQFHLGRMPGMGAHSAEFVLTAKKNG